MRKHVSASGSLLRPREDVESICNSERFPTPAKIVLFVVRKNTGPGAIQGTGQATESASKVVKTPRGEVVSGSNLQPRAEELRLGRLGQEVSTAGW